MNAITQTHCEYLTPNKTIETLSISNCESEIVIYLYNFKGYSFRLFKSKEILNGFWNGMNIEDFHFKSEVDLDHWLQNVAIK